MNDHEPPEPQDLILFWSFILLSLGIWGLIISQLIDIAR
jgi:hypothetical protein